jgi:hypothetical protein
MGTTGAIDYRLLTDDDTALDVLAIRYLVMDGSQLDRPEKFTKRNVDWASSRLDVPVGPEECGQRHPRTATFALPPQMTVTRVALVSALRCSEDVVQGSEVATLSIVGAGGARHDVRLRAGLEVAEATLVAPEHLGRSRHQPAEVFESSDEGSSYFTAIDLPRPVTGARIEVRLHGTAGWLQLQRISAVDGSGAAIPIGRLDFLLANPDRWRIAGRFDTSRISDRAADEEAPGEQEIVVFENRRARPRAWLAREVVPLTEAQLNIAVHHSVLPDGRRFDPVAMALVDAGDAGAAAYGDGPAVVRTQTVEPGRIVVRVSSNGGGFLVLSESYYPGWRARIGDRDVPVQRTNLALQGVTVPSGEHVVTFEFDSLTLRAGAAASAIALLGLLALGAWEVMRLRARAARPAMAEPQASVVGTLT